MPTIKIPKPSFYIKKAGQKIRNWYNNLPSLEDDLARQTCDRLQKVESQWVRTKTFEDLLTFYKKEDPKLARKLEKHRIHIGGLVQQ